MTGGSDTLDFNSVSEAGIGTGARDVVTDFQVTQAGEIIDLSTIDASAAGGNNAMRRRLRKQPTPLRPATARAGAGRAYHVEVRDQNVPRVGILVTIAGERHALTDVVAFGGRACRYGQHTMQAYPRRAGGPCRYRQRQFPPFPAFRDCGFGSGGIQRHLRLHMPPHGIRHGHRRHQLPRIGLDRSLEHRPPAASLDDTPRAHHHHLVATCARSPPCRAR